jgi:hypothetical protein
VLDLITGDTRTTASVKGATELTSDGRFGFLHAPDGTRVVDSGAWTVDHGDHAHYYRAAVRDAGRLPEGSGARVRSDAAVTAVTAPDGRATVHRRAVWEQQDGGGEGQAGGDGQGGGDGEARALPGRYAGAVVPFAERLLTLTDDGNGPPRLTVLDRDGARVTAPDAVCEDPRGDAVTRRGVVLGCADGALLIGEEQGRLTAERIPYDGQVPAAERASEFRHRAGSDTLTAPAGDRAVWVLDIGARAWTKVETGPFVAANTAGEGSPLLVLRTDGTLRGHDIATGREVARTERLLSGHPDAERHPDHDRGGDRDGGGDREPGATPVIEVDRSRAYVNDPVGRRVHEIDYADGLRPARTFDLDIAPVLMAEAGR